MNIKRGYTHFLSCWQLDTHISCQLGTGGVYTKILSLQIPKSPENSAFFPLSGSIDAIMPRRILFFPHNGILRGAEIIQAHDQFKATNLYTNLYPIPLTV